MKFRIIPFGFIILFCFMAMPLFCQSEKLTINDFLSLNNAQLDSIPCKNIVYQELYLNKYGLYTNNISLKKKNSQPIFIHGFKVRTKGNYLLYNPSKYNNTQALVLLNYPILKEKNWQVKGGEKLRYLTTAEEIPNANFLYNWKFVHSVRKFDKKEFWIPNYKSNGKHPIYPSLQPEFDAEIKTLVLYDYDDNGETFSDNKLISDCTRILIRWCGDGIFQSAYNEECDPKDPNKSNWGTKGCNCNCIKIN